MRLKNSKSLCPSKQSRFIHNICFILENIIFVYLSFGPIIYLYFFSTFFISNEKKTQNEKKELNNLFINRKSRITTYTSYLN